MEGVTYQNLESDPNTFGEVIKMQKVEASDAFVTVITPTILILKIYREALY